MRKWQQDYGTPPLTEQTDIGLSKKNSGIAHFRHVRAVPILCFKARESAMPLIWNLFLFLCKKTHFHKKGFARSLVLKVRGLELGNGLLHLAFPPIFVFLLSTTKAVSPAHLILIFAPFLSQEHYPLMFDSAAGSLRVVIVSLSSRLLFFCIPPKEFAQNVLFPRPFKILRSNCLLQCKQ